VLGPRGMPEQMARKWADARTLPWVETILQERDVWVFESEGMAVGWISLTNDTIDGLYTLPSHEQRGIGSACGRSNDCRHLRTQGVDHRHA
jgi:hypothetical protein